MWTALILGAALLVALLLLLLLWPRRRLSAKEPRLRIAFVHPDLGIGGAERLVVDAAVALQQKGHDVYMYTARHEADHCFEETKDGTLRVTVYGNFWPRKILGRFYAACAYWRMCWVSLQLLMMSLSFFAFDIIIVDQVSICLPLLRLARPCGIVFYCHYPDYLLTARTSLLKRIYRAPLDFMEEVTTGLADIIFVNSKFTAGVFAEGFPMLEKWGIRPSVLYPPLNLQHQDQIMAQTNGNKDMLDDGKKLLLSLNRFERKKNIGLAIRTFAALPEQVQKRTKLAVAGGYDERLPENVEHAAELKELARELGVAESVEQKWSISSVEKASLLRRATCLLYTPDREHFGIVPVEAMYAQTPVLAVNTGGPLETVSDGETGYLRCPDPATWAEAVVKLLEDESLKRRMGEAGRKRVADCFSSEAFAHKLDSTVRQLASGLRD